MVRYMYNRHTALSRITVLFLYTKSKKTWKAWSYVAKSTGVIDMLTLRQLELEENIREANMELTAILAAIDVLGTIKEKHVREIVHAEIVEPKRKQGRPRESDKKVIALLRENGGRSAKEIAEEAKIHPTYVFTVLKRMQKDKMIRKYSSRYYIR